MGKSCNSSFIKHRFLLLFITGILVIFTLLAFMGRFNVESEFNKRMNILGQGKLPTKDVLKGTVEEGAPGLPLGGESSKEYFKIFLQTLVMPLLLFVPGILILSLLSGGKLPNWSSLLILGVSALLSLYLLAILALISTSFLPVVIARCISIILLLVLSFFSLPSMKELFKRTFAKNRRLKWFVFVVVIAIYFVFTFMLVFTPYPSLIYGGLGDTAAHCRVAANVAFGGGMMEDYYIGDYATGGKYAYVSTMSSLVVLATAFCYLIFGLNIYSLYVLQICTGLFAVAVLSYLVGSNVRSGKTYPYWIAFLILGFILHPSFDRQIGLGTVALPFSLAATILVALVIKKLPDQKLRIACMVIAGVSLVVLRPEGVIFLGSLLIVFLIRYLIFYGGFSFLKIAWRASLLFLLGAVVIIFTPSYFNVAPKIIENSSLAYIKYFPRQKSFNLLYRPPYEINRHLCRNLLSGKPFITLTNNNLGQEVLSHPVIFLKFWWEKAQPLLQELASNLFLTDKWWILFLFVASLLAAFSREQLPIVITCYLFILLLPLANVVAKERHYYVVMAIISALALRQFVSFSKIWQPIFRYRMIFVVPFVIGMILLGKSGAVKVYHLRRHWRNHTYEEPLAYLSRVIRQGETIASSVPQLITCMTGNNSLGGTWLTENLKTVVSNFHPDYILIDDGREGPPNYSLFISYLKHIRGYSIVQHNPEKHYLILKKNK
jgi:hypothetical protein